MKTISYLKYVFTEPQWLKKLLIPGVIGLIPIAGIPYMLGWLCTILDNTVRGEREKLPQPFSFQYLTRGLQLFAAFLIYYMPLALLFLMKSGLCLINGKLFPEKAAEILGNILSLINSGVSILYVLALLLAFPAVLLIFVRNFEFRQLLDLKQIYHIVKTHKTEMASLTVILCGLILFATFGASLFIVGLCFTIPYACAVFARYLGEHPIRKEI